MASKQGASSFRSCQLALRCRPSQVCATCSVPRMFSSRPQPKQVQRICSRTMATAVSPAQSQPLPRTMYDPMPTAELTSKGLIIPSSIPIHLQHSTPSIVTTVYSFPTMEPLRFSEYPHQHLGIQLRRDLLHKAVIFERDGARQGTASTKHRSEVRGSGRKIRPQKGTGRARLGDKKSPMLRGGGVAHGPKPRDFSTGLPMKVYDKAWRMALSYRYRRGQLLVVDDLDIPQEHRGDRAQYWIRWALNGLGWTKDDRSLFIMEESSKFERFSTALEQYGKRGITKIRPDISIQDLLSMKKLVVEESTLTMMLQEHQADLVLPKGKYANGITTAAEELHMPLSEFDSAFQQTTESSQSEPAQLES